MRLTLFIAFILSFSYGFGQNDSLTIPFVSYWAKGDVYEFKVTRISRQWKDTTLTKDDTSSYVAHFEVIDSTEADYTIQWTFKSNLKSLNIPEKLYENFSAYPNVDLIYKTSQTGEFLGIENWQEIGSIMKRLFADVIKYVAETEGSDKDELLKTLQPILELYESKEGLEQVVFKELNVFHFPFGVEFPIDQPVEYQEELPNLMGGKPIRGDVKVYFTEVDFDYGYCKMIQEMKLNPEDTKQLLMTIYKKMGFKDKKAKKALKNSRFSITDFNTYEYYYDPGVPLKIETRRESIVDLDTESKKRVEQIIIELLD